MHRFDPHDSALAAEHFDRWGYVVLRNGFDREAGERFWADVEQAVAANQHLTYFMYGQFHQGPGRPLDGGKLPRITDVESHVPAAHDLMLASAVTGFLRRWYGGAPPTCLQTLTYMYSSEQGAHSDKTLVSPPQAGAYDRESLVAAWFALEAAGPANGALIVYPGSHRLPKRGMEGEFVDDYGAYVRYLEGLCRDAGCEPQLFEADVGDVLLWHGDLVHAGGPIRDPSPEPPTRKSLVCHYANLPAGFRSPDRTHVRRAHADGSYFHKAAFLPPTPRRSWLQSLMGRRSGDRLLRLP